MLARSEPPSDHLPTRIALAGKVERGFGSGDRATIELDYLAANLARWIPLVKRSISNALRLFLEAEDILDEAFVLACRNKAKLIGLSVAQLDRYFVTLVHGHIRNLSRYLGRKKRLPGTPGRVVCFGHLREAEFEGAVSVSTNTPLNCEECCCVNELVERITELLSCLPDEEAILFIEVGLLGFQLGESAKELALSPKAASAKLYSAKRKLRALVYRCRVVPRLELTAARASKAIPLTAR
jgi:DNA-directed RNA polymerase specialized sigma24 family protein